MNHHSVWHFLKATDRFAPKGATAVQIDVDPKVESALNDAPVLRSGWAIVQNINDLATAIAKASAGLAQGMQPDGVIVLISMPDVAYAHISVAKLMTAVHPAFTLPGAPANCCFGVQTDSGPQEEFRAVVLVYGQPLQPLQ